MQTLLKATLSVSVFTAMAVTATVTATVSDSDTDTAVFNLGGTIEETCKVKGTKNANISSLVIDSSNTAQEIGRLEVWCNTGRNATTKYSSANDGYLVNGNNKVAYTLDIGNEANDLDLSREYTVSSTEAGSGVTGETKAQTLKIKPLATGLDIAGEYSDTITVTVSYK